MPKPSRNSVAFADRAHTLERQRRLKMARSAHAYVRGNTVQFYNWLKGRDKAGIPEGPPIWICGDCHVGNLGPVANADGHVEIEIRDLDQTVVGNPAHDIIRLALSLAMSARGSDLPGVTTAYMVEHLVEGYLEGLRKPLATRADTVEGDHLAPIRRLLANSIKRRWRHLATERIDDLKPTIPLGRRFWKLSHEERSAIETLFADGSACQLVTQLKGRDIKAKVKVVDAAYWMKGCSSLGKLRYAVLLGIGKGNNRIHCLVDIKEGVSAAAPATKAAISRRGHDKPELPKDFAERVVAGATALSPYLGQRMVATTLLDRPVILRELMPQDLKLELDALTCDEAVGAARFLASVVGKAHGRQMNALTRRRWSAELKRSHTRSLDAPNWLWASMVDLVAEHEAGYLDHCRRYATSA